MYNFFFAVKELSSFDFKKFVLLLGKDDFTIKIFTEVKH